MGCPTRCRRESFGQPLSPKFIMESETQTIDVEASAKLVFEMLKDPANMPFWTNGFVLSVRVEEDGVLHLDTMRGVLSWRVLSNADARTIDFYTQEDGPGRATYARVVPRDGQSTVMLTMIRWPHLDEARFARMKDALRVELALIKTMAEEVCGQTFLPATRQETV